MKSKWVEVAAGTWALIFGLMHVVWALGWYVGLDPEKARAAFSRPWFLAYDLAIAAMCFIAVLIAAALVQPRERRRAVAVVAWFGTALLVGRMLASVARSISLAASGQFDAESRGVLMELWFCLGAALWAASVWRFAIFTVDLPRDATPSQ